MRLFVILYGFSNFYFVNLAARDMKLTLTNTIPLTGIPSASGIEFYGNNYYIVGDNSPWLYSLDKTFSNTKKFRIHDYVSNVSDTIPKSIKPDFEAATIVNSDTGSFLLIFGSGAKSPYRDLLVKVDLNNPSKYESFSLNAFYLKLKACGIPELNIEGAVYFDDQLFLLNRADNSIISVSYIEFETLLKVHNPEINVVIHKFDLPVYQNVQAGFSGASLIPGTSKIIYTASFEATDNWIDDGKILGSIVGIIDLNDLEETNGTSGIFLTADEKIIPVKLESVTVRMASKGKAHLVFISDQDDGSSELFEAELKF